MLDRYTYLYDLLGNKTGITKERRNLAEESGRYSYHYDELGRLSGIQKDGQMQTSYEYDAFGNRISQNINGERTVYTYNALNQLTEKRCTRSDSYIETYQYDRRGNLTEVQSNGQILHQYFYGALNRLEEAVNQAGNRAVYRYNGLGHRIGKTEGTIPKEQNSSLNPQAHIHTEIGNLKQIDYTIDLTKEYYNLLEKTENDHTQTYFWDGNVAVYEENGEKNYYLQDELGSPLRIQDTCGMNRAVYGYGAFGEDLYGNQGEAQPFGYTGYQKDQVAGTYYTQAREYWSENGRFVSRDIYKGRVTYPLTINEYIYCGNMPFYYMDLNGQFWHIVCGAVVGAVSNTVLHIGTSLLNGEKITPSTIGAAALGGAVTGGITAATGNVMAGSVIGGAAETVVNGVAKGDSVKDIVQDVAVGVTTDLVFSKAGKYFRNTTKVKELTKQAKMTNLGKKIFDSNKYYQSQITRSRNAWKNNRVKIKPRRKTYLNGFIGVTGVEVVNRMTNLSASYRPEIDLKGEIKKILNEVYDEGEVWIEEKKKIQKYVNETLGKILENITEKELKNILCIE